MILGYFFLGGILFENMLQATRCWFLSPRDVFGCRVMVSKHPGYARNSSKVIKSVLKYLNNHFCAFMCPVSSTLVNPQGNGAMLKARSSMVKSQSLMYPLVIC